MKTKNAIILLAFLIFFISPAFAVQTVIDSSTTERIIHDDGTQDLIVHAPNRYILPNGTWINENNLISIMTVEYISSNNTLNYKYLNTTVATAEIYITVDETSLACSTLSGFFAVFNGENLCKLNGTTMATYLTSNLMGLDVPITASNNYTLRHDFNFSGITIVNLQPKLRNAGFRIINSTENIVVKDGNKIAFGNKLEVSFANAVHSQGLKFINIGSNDWIIPNPSNSSSIFYIDPDLTQDGGSSSRGGNETYGTVMVINSGTISVNGTGYWNVVATNNITVTSGSTIHADGVGSGGGAGTGSSGGTGSTGSGTGGGPGGAGSASKGCGGNGGGYGGAGGRTNMDAGCVGTQGGTYGYSNGYDWSNISLVGSGGGGGGDSSDTAGVNAQAGGAGGGAIILNSSNLIHIRGTVRSSGSAGGTFGSSGNSGAGGGGSGGSVTIYGYVVNISSSSITANGGSGGCRDGQQGFDHASHGAGGGGGRIKVIYATIENTSTTMNSGGAGSCGATASNDGSAGTKYHESNSSLFNSAPVISSVTFNSSRVGGTEVYNLTTSYTDDQTAISAFSFDGLGTQITFTNTTLVLGFSSPTFPISRLLNISDTALLQAMWGVNLDQIKSGAYANETASNTLSSQAVAYNITYNNTNTSYNINVTWDIAYPSGATANTSAANGTISNLNGSQNVKTTFSGDWLTESVVNIGFDFQNASKTSNLSTQYIINRTNLSISNSQGFSFPTVSIGSFCANNASSVTVPTGSSSFLNCTYAEGSSDWLNETLGNFFQDPFQVSEVNGTAYTTRNITIYNNNTAINLANVELNLQNRSGWTGTGQILTTTVNFQNWSNLSYAINNTKANSLFGNRTLGIVNGSIIVNGTNWFIQNVTVNNTDSSVNYTNLKLNFTKFYSTSIYTNLTNAIITNVAVNQNLVSYQLNTTANPIIEFDSSQIGSCPAGYTLQSTSCRKATTFSDRVDYSYIFYINNSADEVKSLNVTYNIPTDRMTSFDATTISELSVNSSVVGVTYATVGSNLQVNISTSHV